MEHQELLDSVPLYAFGVLPDAERIEVEAHLADGCETCGAALGAALDVAHALSEAAPRLEPSPAVREVLLARTRATAVRRERSWLWALPLAAALAAAALLGVRVWRLANEIDSELVRVLTARDTRSIALAGQQAAPDASARAYLNPETRQLLLFAYDLPPPPPGQTYQLWVIVEGKPPISAGVFEIAADGRARHEASTPPEVTGPVTIAVSVEPQGGVPAPTGPIVLAGS